MVLPPEGVEKMQELLKLELMERILPIHSKGHHVDPVQYF